MDNSQIISDEKIFFAGQDYFAMLLSDIGSAKESIEFETYIFALDQLGRQILEVLTEAVIRGVSVRIMVDGAGTPSLVLVRVSKFDDITDTVSYCPDTLSRYIQYVPSLK